MPWTRASNLDRTLQCLASQFLWNTTPAIRLQPKSDRVIDSAAYGTMVHHWKETGDIVGSESHVKTFTKKLKYLETCGVDRLEIWPVTGWHEVAVAYNCVDGRVAVSYEGNTDEFKGKYSEPWVTGSMDYVDTSTDVLWIDDLKTGMLFDKAPGAIAQTYFYLMCMMKIFPRRAGRVSITHWPKYPVENVPVRTEDDISLDLLGKFEELLVKKYKRYKTDPMQFKVGEECSWCPVLNAGMCDLVKKEEKIV